MADRSLVMKHRVDRNTQPRSTWKVQITQRQAKVSIARISNICTMHDLILVTPHLIQTNVVNLNGGVLHTNRNYVVVLQWSRRQNVSAEAGRGEN